MIDFFFEMYNEQILTKMHKNYKFILIKFLFLMSFNCFINDTRMINSDKIYLNFFFLSQ